MEKNNNRNYIIIGQKNYPNQIFYHNMPFLKSHKIPNIMICSICQKKGTSSSMFICQICKIHNVHYYCESQEFFKFGIYICPACDSKRNNHFNEI